MVVIITAAKAMSAAVQVLPDYLTYCNHIHFLIRQRIYVRSEP